MNQRQIEGLERLARLKERGAITEAEFTVQKAALLAAPSPSGSTRSPSATAQVPQARGNNSRTVIGIIAGLALLFVVLERPSSPTGPAERTAPPRSTPAPFAYRPEQMILPPEEFPFVGYVVTLDRAEGTSSWRRNFANPNAPDLRVEVLLTTISSDAEIAELRRRLANGDFCNARLLDALRVEPLPASGLGEASSRCRYIQRNFALQSFHRILVRNVAAEFFVTLAATGTTDPSAVETVLDGVARTQLAILARLAPK